MSELSTRVNSARLPKYKDKVVRLTGRVNQKNTDFAIVEASDGGEVTIQLVRDTIIEDSFIEVIGKVLDATTIKMIHVKNLGNDFDLKIANEAIEQIHDPRFYNSMFVDVDE